MARKLADLVIMSDVDGTIMTREMEIPPRNIEAVRRFVDKGGRFALATGRSHSYIEKITSHLPINFPCVLSNGGVLHDLQTGERLLDIVLPAEAEDYVLAVNRRFPGVGVVVQNDETYFDVSQRDHETGGYNNPQVKRAELSALPQPWYKILFLVKEELCEDFYAFLDSCNFPGVRMVATNEYMHEMLPVESSKGNAIRRLMELRGLERDNLVCIGDYYNDREMIELAGLGVTMSTSPQDLQDLAQMIVGPVEQGSVADLIERLEERFE